MCTCQEWSYGTRVRVIGSPGWGGGGGEGRVNRVEGGYRVKGGKWAEGGGGPGARGKIGRGPGRERG